jgi:hypothetical protein
MGRYGRLGHGDEADQISPRLVGELLHAPVAGVALGERHSAAFTGTRLFAPPSPPLAPRGTTASSSKGQKINYKDNHL